MKDEVIGIIGRQIDTALQHQRAVARSIPGRASFAGKG
jgi:hypothetical protein